MWHVEYLKEAVEDLKRLDHSQQLLILKAIEKVSINPLPQTYGGYGKPLGNRNRVKLAGFLKIKLRKLGLRVIYKLVIEKEIMRIIVISARSDGEVYNMANIRKDSES